MFRKPFSFDGRINRLEYFLSVVIYFVSAQIIASIAEEFQYALLLLIPVFWFQLAQGTKRCHDVNKEGWYQLIPLYFIVLLLKGGDLSINKFGWPVGEEKNLGIKAEIDSIGKDI